MLARATALALMAGALAVGTAVDPAQAATVLVVDRSADEAPDPGNQCTSAPDDCSLRQAVDAAVDGDTIEIADDIDPVLSLGQIATGKDLTIAGQGATDTVIDANLTSRILDLASGSVMSVRDLTLRNGHPVGAADPSGGAIRSRTGLRLERVRIEGSRAADGEDGYEGGSGGAVAANGELAIVDSTFVGNRAGDGADAPDDELYPFAGNGGSGGAVFFHSAQPDRFSVSGSAFIGNVAGDGGVHASGDSWRAGFGGHGGAINETGSGQVVSSTFVGNRTGDSPYAAGNGGAIASYSPLLVRSSTFVANDSSSRSGAPGGKGGALSKTAAGGLTLEASILVDNVGGTAGLGHSCGTGVISGAGGADNVVFPADPGCPAGVTVADPWPDGDAPAPALNGGPTETISLTAGSVAVDHIAAPGGTCEIGATTDQRGLDRPIGAGCDAGAYELAGPWVWSGGGADDLWSNPANWEVGQAPIDGSDIVLPVGPSDRATVLDYDIAPRSLRVDGDYSIAGDHDLDLDEQLVGGGALPIATGASITFVTDVQLPLWSSSQSSAGSKGTIVLAGADDRIDAVNSTQPNPVTVVVRGTYPNLALENCQARCTVESGATVGSLDRARFADLAGSVLGDYSSGSGSLQLGGSGIATGTVGGAATFRTSGSLQVDVQADGAADRLSVAGAVELPQGRLVVFGPASFSGSPPSQLVLIDNAGTYAVVGAFADKPEGTVVPVGGIDYRLTYVGGDGNDVVLVLPDTSPPIITASITPSAPDSGWHTSDVSVTWTVTEPDGPILSSEGCGPTTISADGTTTLTCSVTSAGGTSSESVTIKRDATAPTITASVEPAAPSPSGWYLVAPTVKFTCGDTTSGVPSCPGPVTLSSSSSGPQTVIGNVKDAARNEASVTVGDLLVDLVDPVLVCGATPTFTAGQTGSVSATVSDAHSGPVAPTATSAVSTSVAGTFTKALSAMDVAGNTGTASCPYVVQRTATVLDAHPVLLKITGGVSVNFPLGAKLTTSTGAPLAGQTVAFSVAGRVRCSGLTNAAGFATCGTTLDWLQALLAGGFSATYAPTPAYSGSTDTAGLIG